MPYRLWAKDGDLLTFPGCRSTDPKAVALHIAELHGLCKFKALAFDRWRIEDIKRELDAIGCNVGLARFGSGIQRYQPRGRSARGPSRGRKTADCNPVLAMAAVNAKVELDAAGNRKLSSDGRKEE